MMAVGLEAAPRRVYDIGYRIEAAPNMRRRLWRSRQTGLVPRAQGSGFRQSPRGADTASFPCLPARIELPAGATHQIVRDYLLFYGYGDTLAAFDGAAGLDPGNDLSQHRCGGEGLSPALSMRTQILMRPGPRSACAASLLYLVASQRRILSAPNACVRGLRAQGSGFRAQSRHRDHLRYPHPLRLSAQRSEPAPG